MSKGKGYDIIIKLYVIGNEDMIQANEFSVSSRPIAYSEFDLIDAVTRDYMHEVSAMRTVLLRTNSAMADISRLDCIASRQDDEYEAYRTLLDLKDVKEFVLCTALPRGRINTRYKQGTRYKRLRELGGRVLVLC